MTMPTATTDDGTKYIVWSLKGEDRVLFAFDGQTALLTHTEALVLALELLEAANRIGLGRNKGLADNLLTQVQRAKGETVPNLSSEVAEQLLAQR